jgi:hypothetical protein
MSQKLLFHFVATALLLVNWTVAQGCTQKRSKEEVKIITTAISPNKEYVATVYVVSGGGAAGYVYNVVNLRKQGERFDPRKGVIFSATRARDVGLSWEDNEHLTVRYSKAEGIYAQDKKWGSRKEIHISYVKN